MTTFAVPDTSCRGCPSSHAGTLLQEFHTLHAPSAPTCSICRSIDTSGEVPHTSHSPRLSALAPGDNHHDRGLDGPVPWGLGSMFHPCTKAGPRVSYRGQKGILCTYRVSPQQAETGQLLQHSEPAGGCLDAEDLGRNGPPQSP